MTSWTLIVLLDRLATFFVRGAPFPLRSSSLAAGINAWPS